MSVEQPDVIDYVARDPKTAETLLVMVEVRDWNSSAIAIQQLETKLALYSGFILSGALERQFPEATNRPIRIQLDHFCPITESVGTKLREWSGKLSGIPVSVWSHRMYWNPLLNLLFRIASRLGGAQRGLVRWLPEPDAKLILPTGAQFTEQYCDALRLAIPDHQVLIVKDLEIKVVDPDGKESEGFVGKGYDHYTSGP